jgi:transposase-like protein
LNAAVHRIGPKTAIFPHTLRAWAKQRRIDSRISPGTTTLNAATIKTLEQQVNELNRANEILLAASFFARKLDPRLPWWWLNCYMRRAGFGRRTDGGQADLPSAV